MKGKYYFYAVLGFVFFLIMAYFSSEKNFVDDIVLDKIPDIKNEEPVFLYESPIIDVNILNIWRASGGFERDLSFGQSGLDVSVIKYYLLAKGYFVTLPIDYFDQSTVDAIKNFQLDNLILPISGEFSGVTKSIIYQDLVASYCPSKKKLINEIDFISFPISKVENIQKEYVPPDLTILSEKINTQGIICLREDAAFAYENMYEAILAQGMDIRVTSGYRRYELQEDLYNSSNQHYGAYPSLAKPGQSEHQLGVAVDIAPKSLNYTSTSKQMKYTKEYNWLIENAHLYGFVLSYPEGKEDITGYTFEPWHFRYVGVDLANLIKSSQLTPIEYLKNN